MNKMALTESAHFNRLIHDIWNAVWFTKFAYRFIFLQYFWYSFNLAMHIETYPLLFRKFPLGSYFLNTKLEKNFHIKHWKKNNNNRTIDFFFLLYRFLFCCKKSYFLKILSSESNIQHTYITMSENAWTLKKNGNESTNI